MRVWVAIRASVARFGFLVHGMAALFGLVYTSQMPSFLFLGVTIVLLMMEIVFTYRFNKKGEWKWFVPSAFIHLLTVVPVVWLLELALFDFRVEVKARMNVDTCPVGFTEFIMDKNGTILLVLDFTTELEQITNSSREEYSTIIQQTLMLVMIVGRWLQPLGGLTRDQKSQLLLVYIGMAADMLEFSSETLNVTQIACTWHIYIIILIAWSWSLLQFCLGLTATKDEETMTMAKVHDEMSSTPPVFSETTSTSSSDLKSTLSSGLCGTELWALLTSLFVQDGPFFVIRMYIIVTFNVYDRSMIFFTCKNGLLLSLMCYRLCVVSFQAKKAQKRDIENSSDDHRTQPAGEDNSDFNISQYRDSINSIEVV